MPDREVAARLAALRRESVDLERRLRGDDLGAPDSEDYWRRQIDAWRTSIEAQLTRHPIQLRAFQHPLSDAPAAPWGDGALAELAELRTRLDAIITRIAPED